MIVADYLSIPAILGGLLLVWALLARRSAFDAVLIGLAGLLLILMGLRWHLGSAVLMHTGMWPEVLLALIGLVMLVRVFVSRLGWGHRIGLGLAGCAITLPFLLLAGLIILFSMGSGHDHSPAPQPGAQLNRQ